MKTKERFHVSLGGQPYPINTQAQINLLSRAWARSGGVVGESRLRIYHSDGPRAGQPRTGTDDECWMTY